MYSHLIIALVVVVGLTVLGFRLLTSDFLQKNPLCDRNTVNTVFSLPVLQLGILALAFFPLWAFLPANPEKDANAAIAFLTTDFAELCFKVGIPEKAIEFLYSMQTAYGIVFLMFAAILAYVLIKITKSRNYDQYTIVPPVTAATTVSAIAVWNYVAPLFSMAIMSTDREHNSAMITFVIVINIAIIIGFVLAAIKVQKYYNNALLSFLGVRPYVATRTPYVNMAMPNISVQPATKQCPYCGETIMGVAKKCKHCGEWIKEEDMIIEVPKMNCPTCGEEIDATSTVCPICNEAIAPSVQPIPARQQQVAFSQDPTIKPYSPKPLNTKPIMFTFIGLAVAVVAGVVGYNIYENNKNEELKNAFIEKYSSISVGEKENAKYSGKVPGFSEVDKEFNTSIDNLKKYLSEQYDATQGDKDAIIDTPEYEKLVAICNINASMIKFYRYTGSLMDKGLSNRAATKIADILQTRKKVLMNIIDNTSDYPSYMSAKDNLEYADMYHLRRIGEEHLPYGYGLYDVKPHYEWDDEVIRYINKL
ncbi:MAG: hypothetical protein K2H74_07575 [Paramuribaculum sp.]|nr:hypothetical protein [Paramuribaculum sp.]